MKVIIVGCGRVGEQLARLMAEDDHQVSVVDKDPRVRDRLGQSFSGSFYLGIGFDREVLIKAGIQEADALAATTSSDNANIVAARIARHVFRVPKVIARLYDPRRAEIYQRLGLLTINSTGWAAERIRELITHSDMDPVLNFGSGEVSLLSIETPPLLIGKPARHLIIPGEISVTAITRQGNAFIPVSGSEFAKGDIIHLAVNAQAVERLQQLLGMG